LLVPEKENFDDPIHRVCACPCGRPYVHPPAGAGAREADGRFLTRSSSWHAHPGPGPTPESSNSATLGRFDFHEGRDGFVEFHAPGATGLLIADAVEFTRVVDHNEEKQRIQ